VPPLVQDASDVVRGVQATLSEMTKRKLNDDMNQIRNMIAFNLKRSDEPTIDDLLKIVDRMERAITRLKYLALEI
jgi:hypothetical protein